MMVVKEPAVEVYVRAVQLEWRRVMDKQLL